MNIHFENSDYEIDNLLRFGRKSRFFDLEIFLIDEKNKKIFPFHPLEFFSINKIYMRDLASSEEWDEILRIFEHSSDYTYCKYVERVIREGSANISPELRNFILTGIGYTPARFEDIIYIASLTGNKLKLFVEKKIAVKYLRLLDSHDPLLSNRFTEFLLMKEINGNSCRDLLTMWIDLDAKVQTEIHSRFKDLTENMHKDRRSKIGEEFKKIIFKYRFPVYQARLQEIENLSKEFLKNVRINFDHYLEEEFFDLRVRIESTRDVQDLYKFVNEDNNLLKLEKLLKLVKK